MMTDANYSDASAGTGSETVIRSRADSELPSRSVVHAVSEATGTDPLQMPQLGDVIDPDALDDLLRGGLRSTDDSSPLTDGCVTFRFNGCDVVVHADGRTVVSQASDPPA